MSLVASTPIRLRSTNTVQGFADLTPIKKTDEDILDGVIGILRWVGLGIEVLGTIVASAFTGGAAAIPLITLTGGLFQSSLDTISFLNANDKRGWRAYEFGIGMAINAFAIGGALKGIYGSSKTVLRVAENNSNEFRYVIKGSKEFNEAATAINAGRNTSESFKTITRVRINQQQKLIREGVIAPFETKKVYDLMERQLQEEFSQVFDIGNEGLVSASAGRIKYSGKVGDQIFSNRDMAILRDSIKKLRNNKFNRRQFINRISKMNSSAKERIGLIRVKSGKTGAWVFAEERFENSFFKSIEKISEQYKKVLDETVSIKSGISINIKKIFNNITENKTYKFFGSKQGKTFTQVAQLGNANDVARELLNRPFSMLLDGFTIKSGNSLLRNEKDIVVKGIRTKIRELNAFLEERLPKIYSVLKAPFKTRGYKVFKEINDGLKKTGVITKDQSFIMGWRVVHKTEFVSEVIMYFNPVSTGAKTIGSKNYNGKKPIHMLLSNAHLDKLLSVNDPGHMYLKGGHSFPPIAINSGGKRAEIGSIENEVLALSLLALPIEPLRNILSVFSNFKGVVSQLGQGVYAGKWKSTFVNTLGRLWSNKATKLLGVVLGGMLGKEMEGHISRALKGVVQGFQGTRSRQFTVNGQKFISRQTVFRGTFNAKPFLRETLGQSVISASLRRLPKTTIATPSTTRSRIKISRYGGNLRRIGSIPKV